MPYEIYIEEDMLKEYVPKTEASEAIGKSIEHEYYKSEKQEKGIEMATAQLINNIDT